MWFVFTLYLLTAIKWFILMFLLDNSNVANYFSQSLQYFGPKVFIHFVCVFDAPNLIILGKITLFTSKHCLC